MLLIASQSLKSAPMLTDLVREMSFEHGLDPKLMDALVRVESGYDPRAVSRKGAMGLMQLMPATARRLGVNDPFDPETVPNQPPVASASANPVSAMLSGCE